jgi:hypothetical protein
MADIDRTAERQFLAELLAATRGGRVTWTGALKPGCYQYIAGDYLLALVDEGEGPALALHHLSGHRLETLHPHLFSGPDGAHDLGGLFAEMFDLARIQALGLRRRWRHLAKQLAGAPTQAGA